MGGRVGKTTNWVDDVEDARVDTAQRQQWGEIAGEVVSFNAQNQTATIKPLYKPKFNGKAIDMPELLEVPVRFPRTDAGAITQPVPPGTKVSLRPQMRSTENYHTDGSGEASDSRMFSLSDMEAHLTGGESISNPIQNFDNENLHIRANEDGSFGMKLTKDGKLEIKGAQGEMVDMLAKQAELAAEGFTKLGTEALVHAARYAQIGEELTEIAAKLRGTQKT